MALQDYVGGVTPYDQLTDQMLLTLARRGDKQAETQLSRNALIETHGREAVESTEPNNTAPDRILLVRMLQGDKIAEAEWYRRHPAEPTTT